mmetsp:Transcript_13328/g.25054  ORF Transcript_13328/g.25054 Transcript_13328/m.25054 type:complete len:218 (-) Transcript_13328:808-1461(-)
MATSCRFCKLRLPTEDDGTHAEECFKLKEILALQIPPCCALCDYCFDIVGEEELQDHLAAHQLEDLLRLEDQPEQHIAVKIPAPTRKQAVRSVVVPPNVERRLSKADQEHNYLRDTIAIVEVQELIESQIRGYQRDQPPVQSLMSTNPEPEKRKEGPVLRRRMPSRAAEEVDCTICCEPLKSSQRNTALPCCHVFHAVCIEEWLSSKSICPICRTRV